MSGSVRIPDIAFVVAALAEKALGYPTRAASLARWLPGWGHRRLARALEISERHGSTARDERGLWRSTPAGLRRLRSFESVAGLRLVSRINRDIEDAYGKGKALVALTARA